MACPVSNQHDAQQSNTVTLQTSVVIFITGNGRPCWQQRRLTSQHCFGEVPTSLYQALRGNQLAGGSCSEQSDNRLAFPVSACIEGLCAPASVCFLPAASLFEPSILPQGMRPSLTIFSNPATSLPSLEAAVRFNWDTPTAPGEDSKGLKLAGKIILALTHGLLLEEQRALLQHAGSSGKSPALMLLLLSCMKQLRHSCQRNPQGALPVAGLAGMAGELAVQLLQELVESSTAGSNVSSTAAPTSSSGTPGLGATTGSTPSVPSAAVTPPSTGLDRHPQAPTSLGLLAGQGVQGMKGATEDISGIASAWLVLLGRVLHTAGVALQAVAAGEEPAPNASNTPSGGITTDPTSARTLLTQFQQHAACACAFIESGRAGSRSVHVMLPCDAAARSALRVQQALDVLLSAAAQHAQQLEEAAGAGSSAGGVDGMGVIGDGQQQSSNSNMGIWRRVLGSEQGRQLPKALMDVGSLLCAALPSKFCCNEPSCCCLDKPSELQIVGGKGTKCSGCGVARYCCVAHQRLHWKQHKPACRAIAAAAAKDNQQHEHSQQ